MSYILSIETGTDICSVALSHNSKLISLREVNDIKGHAKNLAIFVEEVLSENRISPEELSAVAVSKGPGSYTGLRIGVSLAKGICYGAKIPLIAVSSLESMAQVACDDYEASLLSVKDRSSALLCPMIDARRMEVYAQLFDFELNPLTGIDAHIIDQDSFKEIVKDRQLIIFGTGAAKCEGVITSVDTLLYETEPSARGMVKLAHKAFESGQFEDIAYFEPFYLKDFVAGVSKKNCLIK